VLCKQISDLLMHRYGSHVWPINYSTAPRSTERLRIMPSPHHTDADIQRLPQRLVETWAEVGLANTAQSDSDELRCRTIGSVIGGADQALPLLRKFETSSKN
jgi:hypothetical protein